jgi:hypothetical protein
MAAGLHKKNFWGWRRPQYRPIELSAGFHFDSHADMSLTKVEQYICKDGVGMPDKDHHYTD